MDGNTWGGSRPKKRDNDQRGGQREGAGRKQAKWNTGGPGTHWVAERETIGGDIRPPETWRVLSVSDDEIEFQCGNDIIVLRRPDEEWEKPP